MHRIVKKVWESLPGMTFGDQGCHIELQGKPKKIMFSPVVFFFRTSGSQEVSELTETTRRKSAQVTKLPIYANMD